ncbi:tyrosine-type recombinase/integrase [Gemella cuniculi]|uniref:tyrosine-type recombinase/integrase n=1 Tax=Gemella cuniculi TaxID=150240 RepID=UPI00041E3972|nr:tyrosine-type recombinase/integrase [Gemella cuniculi]
MSQRTLKKFQENLLNQRNFSQNTINAYLRDLKKLFIYIEESEHKIENYTSWLNEEFISQYIEYLRKNKYSPATLSRAVSTVHIFIDYLYDEKIISNKINVDIKINRDTKEELVIFTREEIARILDIDAQSLTDYRDKAVFELSYSIGIKPTECINLEMKNVNLEIGYLKYKRKNGYRTVPLNKESVDALKNYLEELKKIGISTTGSGKLFLNHDGQGISRQGFWKIFKKRQQELKLKKELNTMNFRNSLAIHLLEDKVPVEEVQEILGLKNINSLKLYLKNVQDKKTLKRVINNHPRKAMK